MKRPYMSGAIGFDQTDPLGRWAPISSWLFAGSLPLFSARSGDNVAGNGGDGYFVGSLLDSSDAAFKPLNAAEAGGNATADAHQTNIAYSDQTAVQTAGVGGNGGNHNGTLSGTVEAHGPVGNAAIGTGDNGAGNGGNGYFSALMAASPVDRLLPSRVANAIETARSRHPGVGLAMFGIDGAVLQVKINEGSLYPMAALVGGANYNWESDLSTALRQFNAFVKAQISVPIYQGGSEYALIRQAKETVAQKRFDLDAARDAVQQNVVQTWAQLEAAKAQIQATQAQVAAAEVALNGVREEARSGQRTTLDVLNAQQELVNARSALVVAQHDRVLASYTLLAAVGQLNLPKLGIRIPLTIP
jgi:hypothetical protein